MTANNWSHGSIIPLFCSREETLHQEYSSIIHICYEQHLQDRIIASLACYTAIHCYLDNDKAGLMAAHTIMERYQNKAINESIRYAEYKDINDYLIGRKSINIAVE